MSPYCDEDFVNRARAADPLAIDLDCSRLPELNKQRDINGMASILRLRAGWFADAASATLDDCVAAMRDLGIFLGSIKRHGVEPLEVVPELTPLLARLGARTDMVPRDTIFHYTLWNPTDRRQRMYTDDPQESYLQESVRMVLPDIRAGLEKCDELMLRDPQEAGFRALVQGLEQHLRPMVDSMILVRERVTPEFFTDQLRPYLEDVRIEGKSYFGPAAAQVPMWLVDVALWGASEPGYQKFWHGLVPYALPRWRAFHGSWRDRAPLSEKVAGALAQSLASGKVDDRSRELVATGAALMGAIEVMVQFRGRHMGIAKQAYQRSSSYQVGSGGGSVELLREILDLTRAALVAA